MSRVIFLVSFLVLVSVVISLKSYQRLPLGNERFDMEKEHKAYEVQQKLIRGEVSEDAGKDKGPDLGAQAMIDRGMKVFTESGQCITCHGEKGEGNKEKKAPKIAGQYAWYIEEQLKNFKKKVRVNVDMEPYLEKLNDQDFTDVAKYLSTQGWP